MVSSERKLVFLNLISLLHWSRVDKHCSISYSMYIIQFLFATNIALFQCVIIEFNTECDPFQCNQSKKSFLYFYI